MSEVPEHDAELDEETRERLRSVGGELDEEKRSASYLQIDQNVTRSSSSFENVEVMGIKQAMEKYDWVKDYMWKVVDREKDEYTKAVDTEDVNGYFIRSMPNAKVEFPVEACLYLKKAGGTQKVHNIIIAEEGSELNIISGCTSHPGVASGLHLGVSEFYVKKNAKLTFTMIHSWESGVEVRPRSASIVEEDGVFISNYILMNPVKIVQMYPVAYLEGDRSTAIFSSVIVGLEGAHIDAGSKAVLRGNQSGADIISRTISRGGDIIARGDIVGESRDARGHLECRGLMLSEKGMIHAIPELEGKFPDLDLSHEAAIGKIAEEEIFYLMSRGLSRDEATTAIIRGFMDIEIKGLPDFLKKEIDKAVSMVEEEITPD